MFLKRLELHGFKSFAHRTAIDFMPGVTIVVGPNGCGKSNVLDGLRWVLGETSAKSLRGERMGDVLFRGSSSLRAAHFAQVSLLIDNSSTFLKIDQSEVLVSRRLFSNGDSEYQLNKQTCRMRDVHDLLLDTGLGSDGYSIIEQGQIGALVAARPAERRTLFEEAAGISRYKMRREETLRKLVRTEEDLLRVFDIVNEVQKNCNSLYRQAKKAERHRRLTRRLARLQRRLLVLRHALLRDKIAALDGQLEKARNEFEAANTKLVQAEAARSEASRLVEEAQRQMQAAQQERYDLLAAMSREQRRGDLAKQSQQTAIERLAALDRELASSESRISVLANTLSALEADLERDRAALHRDMESADAKQKQLEAMRAQHDEANRELAKIRHELQAERAKESRVLQDKNLADSLTKRLREELEGIEAHMAAMRDDAEVATREADIARADMTARRAKLKSLRAEWDLIRNEISKDDAEKVELARGLETVTKSYNTAFSRYEALQELEESYEGYFAGVKEVMKAVQQGRLQGIVGVLSSVITVPKNIELAVEVILGASLQDIIAASEKDAQAAIQFLKSRNAGRATFLPLDHLQTNVRYDHLRPLLGRPGVIGIAKELVKYDPKIEAAIERRFGNALIVEKLHNAVQLQREGIRNRYVSLDGDLADPTGVLTGGSSQQSRGLLSRSREIRTLKDEVELLDGQRKHMAEKLSAMKDRLSKNHARAAELQTELHAEQMAEARVEKDLQAAESRARDRRNALATAEARQMQQRVDLQKHEETALLCGETLAVFQAAIAQREAALAAGESQFGDRGAQLQALGDEVAGARAVLGALRERVNGMAAKLAEVKRDSEHAAQDRTRREAERGALERQRDAAAEEIVAAERMQADLIRERDAIEARLGQMAQENEASLKEARESVSMLQGLQRDRNIRENALRDVETQVAELRAQMAYVEQEANDEFGETLDAVAQSLEEKAEEINEGLVSPDGAEEEKDEDAGIHEEDDQITDTQELRRLVNEMREKIARMGGVNETAIEEYKQQKERLDFLHRQRDDLIGAKDSLRDTIKSLDETTTRLFTDAFNQIRTNFQENFRRLFIGGKGDLILVEEEGKVEPGIEITAQPPGKNIGTSITLLSGGEKAMTAIALTFALFQFRPSPICVLDEIDAPLDDTNCQRLCTAIKEFSKTTQFLVITHNKITMSLADSIYGVTMQEPGISKVVSVKFSEIDDSGLLDK